MRFQWFERTNGLLGAMAEFSGPCVPGSVLGEMVRVLSVGGVVGLPTDTVYGLSCLVDGSGVEKIFAAKGRPRDVALPVLVANSADAERLLRLSPGEHRALSLLAGAFWPGPLTVVAHRAPAFEADLGGSDPHTVAVRVPAAPVLRAILIRSGPMATTSANAHGATAMTSGAEFFLPANAAIHRQLGGLLVDDTPLAGQASTVVDIRGGLPRVLRQGPIGIDAMVAVLD